MNTLSQDVAENEFQRFADTMCISTDESTMDAADLEQFRVIKQRLIKALMIGSLIINEHAEPVFTPQRAADKSPLTFHEPKGSAISAMDRKKQSENVGKIYVALAEITETNAQRFNAMPISDLNICMGIFQLFFG